MNDLAALAETVARLGVTWIAQSTVLILICMFGAWLLRRRGAAGGDHSGT